MMYDVLYDRHKIKKRVVQMGRQIAGYYQDRLSGGRLVVLCPLKGSFVFAADLIREIDYPLSVEFIYASSYRGGKKGGVVDVGNVGPNLNLHGKNVLIVEDIIHTGRTIQSILSYLRSDAGGAQQWNDLQVCTLLAHTTTDVKGIAKWTGFDIPNPYTFVAGYGMDYKEQLRNYPDIVIID